MRTILKFFYRSSSVYLAIGDSTGELTEASSWLDSKRGENLNRHLEVRFRQGCLRPWMEVILVMGVEWIGVDPKQYYLNGLADPLSVKQLEL